MTILIDGMQGLGDNIYQRAFIEAIASQGEHVFLRTPWPQLYIDIPGVSFVAPTHSRLRTQAKNAQRSRKYYSAAPGGRWLRVSYDPVRFGSIWNSFVDLFRVNPSGMSLPPVAAVSLPKRPLALFRPVTVRTEWRNPARNPLPEYVWQLSAIVKETHHVVSIADLAAGQEWALDPLPEAHESFHKGELNIETLLAYVVCANMVVTAPGWAVPAALAAGTRLFTVFGGQGTHNSPSALAVPGYGDYMYGYATPEPQCMCSSSQHNCNKVINNLEQRFISWAKATR